MKGHYVGGRFDTSGDQLPMINPVDGQRAGVVPQAGEELVDRAVLAARRTLAGAWGDTGVAQRHAALRRVADGIESRFAEFVAAEVADTGKPWWLAATVDVPRAIANFRTYADLALGRVEHAVSTVTPGWSAATGRGQALNYTVSRPLGVVAVIVPWNLPLLLLTWKVAPALAMGNAVVAKPSELTPSSATLLAEVIDTAGVPAGTFNLLHGRGPGATGELLTQHPGVDAIAFTGGSGIGKAIMHAAAERLVPVSFELGGKNPAVVFADADLDAAVDDVLASSFTHAGQICLCTERIYVQRPVFDDFVASVGKRAAALAPGWPQDDDAHHGPLISAEHREKVLGYYRLAVAEGATVVAGGGIPSFGDARDGGFYLEPTVLTGLSNRARSVREEIFGPVCHIAPFDDDDDALRLVNDSPYGLAATMWTGSLSRAHRLAPRIEAGMVWVNCWNLRDLRTPFGGTKASGIGREGGAYSLEFFSEPVNVCVGM